MLLYQEKRIALPSLEAILKFSALEAKMPMLYIT
jgi:hypothetical protein